MYLISKIEDQLCRADLLFFYNPSDFKASAKRANSSKLRASPRTLGDNSARSKAAVSLPLVSSDFPKQLVRLFQRVFLRWTKLALEILKKNFSSCTATAGWSLRTILRIAESTLGAGTKTVRGTTKATLAVM